MKLCKLISCKGEYDEETVFSKLSKKERAIINQSLNGNYNAGYEFRTITGEVYDVGIVDEMVEINRILSKIQEWKKKIKNMICILQIKKDSVVHIKYAKEIYDDVSFVVKEDSGEFILMEYDRDDCCYDYPEKTLFSLKKLLIKDNFNGTIFNTIVIENNEETK